MIRRQLTALANTWLDTPFLHQGRIKNIGVDCAGYLYLLALEAGIDTKGYKDNPVYGKDPDNTMEKILSNHLKRINKSIRDILPGNILFFRFSKLGQHVGIVAENTDYFYHAYEPVGCVTLTRLDKKWQTRIKGIYDYYGIED